MNYEQYKNSSGIVHSTMPVQKLFFSGSARTIPGSVVEPGSPKEKEKDKNPNTHDTPLGRRAPLLCFDPAGARRRRG